MGGVGVISELGNEALQRDSGLSMGRDDKAAS